MLPAQLAAVIQVQGAAKMMQVRLWHLHQGFLHETAPAAGSVCCAFAENAQQAVIAGDDDKDLLKQQGSLQDAVFGVSHHKTCRAALAAS